VIKSNFTLLGSRDYVHSTSIIEFIYLNRNNIIGKSNELAWLDIKFYKIITSNCLLEITTKPSDNINEDVLCEAIIRRNKSFFFVYFRSQPNNEELKKASVTYNVEEIDFFGQYSGDYMIKTDCYSSFIINIVESNKRVHLASNPNSEVKILNMFMKNVPLFFDLNSQWTKIKIQNIGFRGSINENISTLNKLNINGLKDISLGYKLIRN